MSDAGDVEMEPELSSKGGSKAAASSMSLGGASSSESKEAKDAAPAASSKGELPWVEKYRPRTLKDVVGNLETIERLRVIAQHGNMPNLIITGPPGTGKTTSVMALARELLADQFENAVLEMNASDARGIDIVRNKIKMFAQKKVTLAKGRHKIIILDEADSMTKGAQQALRRTMELYSSTTRFALACNESSKIIEPLQSRCAILRFTKLSDKEVLKRMKEVLEAEKISAYTEDGLEAILFTAQGDMRHAINNMQSTFSGLGLINQENVFKVVDQPHPLTVRQIILCCAEADIEGAIQNLRNLWNLGYAPIDIVGTLFRVTKTAEINERLKLSFVKEIGFAHMRIADGCSTLLQLTGLISRLCQATIAMAQPGASSSSSSSGSGTAAGGAAAGAKPGLSLA